MLIKKCILDCINKRQIPKESLTVTYLKTNLEKKTEWFGYQFTELLKGPIVK